MADMEPIRGFLAGLSPQAQHLRFFTGLGSVSPSLVRKLVTASERQEVVIALDDSVVIGHAVTVTVTVGDGDGVIELGVVVSDRHRRPGVATRLVGGLLERATERGAGRLQLEVLRENQVVLDWIRRRLPGTRFEPSGDTVTASTELRSGCWLVPGQCSS